MKVFIFYALTVPERWKDHDTPQINCESYYVSCVICILHVNVQSLISNIITYKQGNCTKHMKMYEIPLTFVFGVFGVGESIFSTGVLGVDVLSSAFFL